LHGIPENPHILETVLLNEIGLRTDVDILLCPPRRPDLAIAIETKRIKVRGSNINNLKALQHGVRQANQLAGLRFSQVYLFIFIVADSREQNRGKISCSGPDSTTRSFIAQAISRSVHKLFPQVGAFQCEFVQPTDDPPLTYGTSNASLLRLARSVQQPFALTRWIANKFRNHY
jgi:hypothetical protein